jgi:fructose-bisphosphate aldolase class II
VLKLFTYAREKGFAIPAVNVTSSSTVVASLEAARDAKAPIMYEMTPPRPIFDSWQCPGRY